MLGKKVFLVPGCCLFLVVAVGCATPGMHAEQPLHTSLKDTQGVGVGVEDALVELLLSLDRVSDIAYRHETGSGSPVSGGAGEQLLRRYVAGNSVENKPLEYIVLGDGLDVILILATIHGNESAGTPLVLQLAKYLRQHPLMVRGRTIVLVPVANPDGKTHNRRFNANGVDLNRNFEVANRLEGGKYGYRVLSEPESRFIYQLIHRHKPDRIVSIHQPLTCVDYDGPAKVLAECMARYCDLPVRKLGTRPGSLGSYAGEKLRIPIITFELSGDAASLDSKSLWTRYGNALIAAVLYPDIAK